jgi:hypothetical protein
MIAVAALASAAAAATPVPRLTGPLPSTSESHPFGGAAYERQPEDLAAIGYIEEEFLVSGTANVYDWNEPGPATVRTAGAPYTTRMLVRRPIDRARFNGAVVVEMLNPSNLFDLNIGWALSHKEIVRQGWTWVGFTSKPVAIATLKTFDPLRYAALSFANPLPLDDARNCANVPSDSVRTTENGLVWDMYTQIGALLRSRDRANPLLYGASPTAPHPVEHLYAWGYSQIGQFLYTYINAVHPRVTAADGRSMFDAYLIGVASGPAPINQCAPPIPAGDPRRTITRAGVPVVRVMSQSDYLSGISARRQDSDDPDDRYRNYEIAGAAHATPDELIFAAAPADIERGGRMVPPMACNEGPRSRFPNGPAFNAVLRNLDVWVRTATPPPRVAPIRVENGQPVLDEAGNVTGGIRSPYVDVPTSRWLGNATGPSFCRIAGYEEPFDPARLAARYPDADAYINAVTADVSRLVGDRVLTSEDGRDLVDDARRFAAGHLAAPR